MLPTFILFKLHPNYILSSYLFIRVGRLKKFLSAWVAFDAIFRADSENRIKKIIKNGLGGGRAP